MKRKPMLTKSIKREVIVHRFYAGDKNVWVDEWYEPFSIEELRQKATEITAKGYGHVNIVTDSKGRLVNLKIGSDEHEGDKVSVVG